MAELGELKQSREKSNKPTAVRVEKELSRLAPVWRALTHTAWLAYPLISRLWQLISDQSNGFQVQQ